MVSIEPFLQAILEHPGLRAAQERALAPAAGTVGGISISGLTSPAKAIAAALLAHQLSRPIVILTSDNDAAEGLARTASTVLDWLEPGAGEAVVSLSAFDCSPYEARSPHPDILERRAVGLWRIACGQVRVLAAPLPAAMMRYRPLSFYRSLALRLKISDEIAPEDLAEHLLRVGYEPSEPVLSAGQYSVRGGIVDIFPPEVERPARIEFFGDTIESMREFDPANQRSSKSILELMILPLTEAAPPSNFFSRLVDILARRVPEGRAGRLPPGWSDSFSAPFPGWEFYVPLVEPRMGTLVSLLERPVILWDEPADRQAQLTEFLESLQNAFDAVRDVSPQPPRPDEVFLKAEEFQSSIVSHPSVFLHELDIEGSSEPPEFLAAPVEAAGRFYLNTQPVPKFQGSLKLLAEQLRVQIENGENIVLAVPTSAKADRLREIFADYEIPFENVAWPKACGKDAREQTTTGDVASAGRALRIARGELEAGVVFPDLHLLLLSERDILGEFTWGAARRRENATSSFLSDLSDLKVGDYVVHIDHGIGVYQGLKQLPVGGSTRDFMLLTYQDDARLYVPLERLDLVEKYRSSGDGVKPGLDRLGGSSWQRTKKRVQRALRDMAEELLRLYAERKMRGGTAVAPDNNLQKEFEDSFPFEETPDQLTAIADIKGDLESPEPMDRLLCGDVGYGKTELAMRAAFKVVQESRQVAVLAPTTVLAFQHYTTFCQRMSHFPVRVEMLSRFRSAAEIRKTVADIEAGKVDIVIGTHRMLSKDVQFQDLGLLVVDEEQRFGVAAKERLKKLKANVDVLTMSATPIPRTLHMALGGLRDLSVIESPPRGRLAIQTTVAAFNDGLIQSAIQHEMDRGGQIYFVHNRVESIFTIAALLQRLVPAARIGVAHGQMGERELERAMLKFMEGKYDMLVATSLVENGLDIPRANTMIVNHAERFGLSDLYQLRGRVGRSDRRAYAFFLVPTVDTLTPIAKRRLAALKEFSDLGAGFRLAALDLELRGAGNVLGQQQHGHLNAIGIDLYLRMLDEAVHELKGEPSRPEVRTTFNLGINIKIPESYIADERQRLRMYKRISALKTMEGLQDMEAELTDRYGPIPVPVEQLLNYAVVKSRAEQLMIQTVERKGSEVRMRFHEQTSVSPQKLMEIIKKRRGVAFQPDGVLRMQIKDGSGDPLKDIENILLELQPQR
ncbi:MAG: transcription-repair coupling factor [Acidobacteria bacterium]|nr:MAG: transcription-repair coupling factor [Acidobacteriota bacterium]